MTVPKINVQYVGMQQDTPLMHMHVLPRITTSDALPVASLNYVQSKAEQAAGTVKQMSGNPYHALLAYSICKMALV